VGDEGAAIGRAGTPRGAHWAAAAKPAPRQPRQVGAQRGWQVEACRGQAGSGRARAGGAHHVERAPVRELLHHAALPRRAPVRPGGEQAPRAQVVVLGHALPVAHAPPPLRLLPLAPCLRHLVGVPPQPSQLPHLPSLVLGLLLLRPVRVVRPPVLRRVLRRRLGRRRRLRLSHHLVGHQRPRLADPHCSLLLLPPRLLLRLGLQLLRRPPCRPIRLASKDGPERARRGPDTAVAGVRAVGVRVAPVRAAAHVVSPGHPRHKGAARSRGGHGRGRGGRRRLEKDSARLCDGAAPLADPSRRPGRDCRLAGIRKGAGARTGTGARPVGGAGGCSRWPVVLVARHVAARSEARSPRRRVGRHCACLCALALEDSCQLWVGEHSCGARRSLPA